MLTAIAYAIVGIIVAAVIIAILVGFVFLLSTCGAICSVFAPNRNSNSGVQHGTYFEE